MANVSQTGDAMNCLTETFTQNILSQSAVETYKLFSAYDFAFELALLKMNHPAASCGYQKTR